ncbi:MAG: hypothetical protein AB203_01070 [Parcubacteria bacterium C7867-008]|nr:MAG: hypothetical protein AB203_01070 [Parcubacteria bacterium C7867-008]
MRTTKYTRALKHLEWDAIIIVFSVLLALFLVEIGAFERFLNFAQGIDLVAAFIAGIFFTSTFTIAPASIAFVEIGNASNMIQVAVAGALGAVCGDMILFFFIRDTIMEDLKTVLRKKNYHKIIAFTHGGIMRWLSPVIGALIIASPLPDEVGLTIMGMSKIRSTYLIPIAFVMNFLGIWAIISIAVAL